MIYFELLASLIPKGHVLTAYDAAIEAYDKAATALADLYNSGPGGVAFSGCALDVGAGSGRDARWRIDWIRRRGEPSRSFREIGSRTPSDRISWIDDRLPMLDHLSRLELRFDLIILSAVWQHIYPLDRDRSLGKLITLLRSGGVLTLHLTSGPAPVDRPTFPKSVGETEALARIYGLEIRKFRPLKICKTGKT